MKKFFMLLVSIMIFLNLFNMPMTANAETMNNFTFNIDGFDIATNTGIVCVYPNESETKRVIGADDYGFRNSKMLIFDEDGKLIEAGENIYSNSSGVTGSPQLSVTVPAGGFLVAFSSNAPAELKKCYTTAMEGAMLYNATMSVIYKVEGSYNKQTKKLNIVFADPKGPSDKAIKFLFVGNSSTYFNGIPIKFKGLCEAAGIEVDVEYCTFGSAYLSEFADESHERGKVLRQKLDSKKYDYVVLQDAGSANYYVTNPQVEILLPLIEKNGAKPLLYMRYSGDSQPESRYESTVKHYTNYSRIAEEKDIVCAPVAVAFLHSTNDYPDINLYADDNSHHSKEGSYLAACTFLYKYLGVSPINNNYTAQLSDDVAQALQKCAVKACDEKFIVGSDVRSYTENGVNYLNLAHGKKYVATGEVYQSDKWTDTDTVGKPMGKLTDGIIAKIGSDTAVGCYKGKETSITVDLGAVHQIKRTETDLHGNSDWGIPDPGSASVKVSISIDGTDFNELGAAKMSEASIEGGWKSIIFALTLDSTVEARYVRLTYTISGNFCWASEIEIFGTENASEISQENSPGSSIESSSDGSDSKAEVSNGKQALNKSPIWPYIVIGIIAAITATVSVVFIKKKAKSSSGL